MIEVIETDPDLAALAPEWAALWQRCPAATPFQSPHWLLPWWRQFGTGMPRVAVERRGGALGGLLPLYILPGERKALPIGAGTADYLDALGDPAPLLPQLLARLADDPVDQLDLIEVPPWSRLLEIADIDWHQSSPCPVLTLPDLPAGIRRKLRMNRHRADRAGGWSVETADAANLHASLEVLVHLHQSRWMAEGLPGVLADPMVLAFWRDAAPGLLAAGLLRLQLLRVGRVAAAAIMALLAPGRLFFYLSGFDVTQSFVSPGTLLLGAMLEQANAEGRTEAHFLRGREAYKYAWGAADRLNYAGRLAPPRASSAR
ncbi:MAG: GNAT family N-acetyltransferase [Acetobacteraceae bacterium]|nr:GNAT family N-acetyltransferase [Acetobacteraceae bacterium]